MALEPPKTFPRGHTMVLFAVSRCGSTENCQENLLSLIVRKYPTGRRSQKPWDGPPASNNRTRQAGSALNRLAKTQPAEPAPTMM